MSEIKNESELVEQANQLYGVLCDMIDHAKKGDLEAVRQLNKTTFSDLYTLAFADLKYSEDTGENNLESLQMLFDRGRNATLNIFMDVTGDPESTKEIRAYSNETMTSNKQRIYDILSQY